MTFATDFLPVDGFAVGTGRNPRPAAASRYPMRRATESMCERPPAKAGGHRIRRSMPVRLLRGMLLLGLCLPVLTVANETTGVLQISLRVVASCTVQTRPLVFATYTAGGSATGTATPGVIDVSCTRGVPAAVYLDGDRTLAGPVGARVAYTVQANGQAWPAGASIEVLGQGAQPIRLRLSGNVPAGQNVMPGDYADAAVVRVVY